MLKINSFLFGSLNYFTYLCIEFKNTNIMRLFQLIDSNSGDNIGLYYIAHESVTDQQAEELIKENYGDDNANEILAGYGIIRVFVTEVYI